ncbi:MAG: hypothetical protein EBR51_09045, partial [Gammaproteobacteria bacterium]|nr:hypothetical protein [Gammaproteobacteria bacterium]
MHRILLLALLSLWPTAQASIAGTGTLEGAVQADAALGQLSVYAYNAQKRVGYMVFVVDGRYRATNLFPRSIRSDFARYAGAAQLGVAAAEIKGDVV